MHPSSAAQTTVSTASGICHTVTATCRHIAPDDEWWYHPKYVEQFSDKINCVKLHLVGHILEHSYNAWTHERYIIFICLCMLQLLNHLSDFCIILHQNPATR
jgi:hypothetical protein